MNPTEVKSLEDSIKAMSPEERLVVIRSLPVTEMLQVISERYTKIESVNQSIINLVNKE